MSDSPASLIQNSKHSSNTAIMAGSQSGNSGQRSSLYAAIRLTRLVLHVSARLKSRVKSRKQLGNLEAQVFDEISR